jgi:homopolymeric O-antigen transport system permease protein
MDADLGGHMHRQAVPTEDLGSPVYRLEGAADTWSDWHQTATLVKHLTRRHLAARYRGSVLGFVWSFLHPLLMMCVYTFVFHYVFRAAVPGVPYPAFFLTGILAWNFFSIAAMNAATSVADNVSLINKTYFPRLVLPLSAVLSNAVNYLVTIPLLLVFNLLFGIVPGLSILLLPVAVLLLLLVATGVGLLTAGLALFFRDLLQLLDVVFTAWFFATPVLYPMSLLTQNLPDSLLPLYYLNPMVGAIHFVQAIFLGGSLPVTAVVMSVCASAVLLGIGLGVFSRLVPHFSNT